MAEQRAERDNREVSTPAAHACKLAARLRARATRRHVKPYSSPCNRDGRARCFLGMSTERARAQDLDAMSQASA